MMQEAAAILIMVRACFGWRPSTATKALGSMFEERYPGIFLLGTEDDRCLTLKNMYPRMPQKLIDETVMIGTIRRLIKCNTLDQFFQRKLYGHEERAIWRVECELVASVLGKRMKIGQKKMYSFSELESRVKHEAGLYFELWERVAYTFGFSGVEAQDSAFGFLWPRAWGMARAECAPCP